MVKDDPRCWDVVGCSILLRRRACWLSGGSLAAEAAEPLRLRPLCELKRPAAKPMWLRTRGEWARGLLPLLLLRLLLSRAAAGAAVGVSAPAAEGDGRCSAAASGGCTAGLGTLLTSFTRARMSVWEGLQLLGMLQRASMEAVLPAWVSPLMRSVGLLPWAGGGPEVGWIPSCGLQGPGSLVLVLRTTPLHVCPACAACGKHGMYRRKSGRSIAWRRRHGMPRRRKHATRSVAHTREHQGLHAWCREHVPIPPRCLHDFLPTSVRTRTSRASSVFSSRSPRNQWSPSAPGHLKVLGPSQTSRAPSQEAIAQEQPTPARAASAKPAPPPGSCTCRPRSSAG